MDGAPLADVCDFIADKTTLEKQKDSGCWFEADSPGTAVEIRIGFSLNSPERPSKVIEKDLTNSFAKTAQEASERWDSANKRLDSAT